VAPLSKLTAFSAADDKDHFVKLLKRQALEIKLRPFEQKKMLEM
jgi:hypothetical protein